MHDGTSMTVLQDSREVDFFKQVGRDVLFHDDLVVYDRCGDLFQHFCTLGPMGSCSQIHGVPKTDASLLNEEGYKKLREAILQAASASSKCGCQDQFTSTSLLLQAAEGGNLSSEAVLKPAAEAGNLSGEAVLRPVEKPSSDWQRVYLSLAGLAAAAIVWICLWWRQKSLHRDYSRVEPVSYGSPDYPG